MRFDKQIVAFANAKRERERERVIHSQNHFIIPSLRASIILPVIASERSERGNLNGIANDGQNTQLAIQ